MTISNLWKKYKNKKVRIIVRDIPFPKARDGVFKDIDESHIFLEIEEGQLPKPFLKDDIKRVEIKE